MIRTLIAATALSAGFLSPASAQLVDNFQQHNQILLGVGSNTNMDHPLKRTVTITSGADASIYAGPDAEGGQLSVNSDLEVPAVSVSWLLNTGFFTPATAGNVAAFKFDLESDIAVQATLKMGTTILGELPPSSGIAVASFAIGASESALIAAGGTLSLLFTSVTLLPYDVTIDNVRFEVSAVPENSTALMLLAGLLATAGMRHRMARRESRV